MLMLMSFVLGREVGVASAQIKASRPAIQFGNAPLAIGMPKSHVLTVLAEHFIVENSGQRVRDAEFWLVKDKGQPTKIVGNVQFKKNALVEAVRDWDSLEADHRLVQFAKRVYGAMESATQVTSYGRVLCQVHRQPEGVIHKITVDLGNRSFALYLAENDDGFYNEFVVQEGVASDSR